MSCSHRGRHQNQFEKMENSAVTSSQCLIDAQRGSNKASADIPAFVLVNLLDLVSFLGTYLNIETICKTET